MIYDQDNVVNYRYRLDQLTCSNIYSSSIHYVETKRVKSMKAAKDFHTKRLAEGYDLELPEKEALTYRLQQLSGGIAILRVGAATESELIERLVAAGVEGNMDEINALDNRVLRGKIKAAIVKVKRAASN